MEKEITKTREVFLKDLIKMSAELGNVKKNKQGFGYKYADLGSILEYVKPILETHNFALLQTVGSYLPADSKEPMLKITTILLHNSGEQIVDHMILPPTPLAKGNLTQAMGASITYARRYSIGAILGISTEEDTDGLTKQEISERSKEIQKPSAKPIGTLEIAKKIIENTPMNEVRVELGKFSWKKEDHDKVKEMLIS